LGSWVRFGVFNIHDYLLQKFQNFSSNISEVIVDRPQKISHFQKINIFSHIF